ncbi:MAG: ABC transporter ATP-binding protein [Desulfobacterales bacterium]|jgi:branched-chain amino acid transport system ATP-binding protein
MTILEAVEISKHFGGLMANDHVSFRVEEGKITSIIGPNGAGKTTLFNLLTGMYKPDAGKVLFDGRDITGWPIHRIVNQGIVRSFQVLNIFNEISPAENIRLAVQSRKKRSFNFFRPASAFDDINRETNAVLEEIGLTDVKDLPTKTLSYGDKRVLEIGIAMASEPRLLLMDEPTSGLPTSETERIKKFIKKISSQLTVLVIEHDMDIVLTISDTIIVLHQGRVIAQGPPAEIKANDEVQTAYLGGID